MLYLTFIILLVIHYSKERDATLTIDIIFVYYFLIFFKIIKYFLFLEKFVLTLDGIKYNSSSFK